MSTPSTTTQICSPSAHPPPTPSSTATTLPLPLPLELRNQIYTLLFQGLQVEFIQQDLITTMVYPNPASGYRYIGGLPLWLLTNKTFLSEGLAQFYYGSYITSCAQALIPRRPSSPVADPEAPLPPSLPKLLDMRHVKAVDLDPLSIQVSKPGNALAPSNEPTRAYVSRRTGDFGGPFQNLLRAFLLLHSLKFLTLALTLPYTYPAVYDPGAWCVDLDALDQFPAVLGVRFKLRQERHHCFSGHERRTREVEEKMRREKWTRKVVVPLLKRELRGIAKRLVGELEYGCAVREWMFADGCLVAESEELGPEDETWDIEWWLDVSRDGVRRGDVSFG
ncbi:hypothetical protein K505DRAFT_325215 [Melanomma pulvis-pyrius CBS 109.77]|uniref:Uncharacterized protein n=1 Tax=Melanomma pulvis-pyrius CBS 109.77 TaxID=1314802 RepID=A0A6A6XCU0_9PLEO|nr:hypothetical protein K505DRAFT_325215 [Melanomma pulvis-pyrius CBS 109.77]